MEKVNEKYTPVIGLEVHVELKTNAKMFCSCSATYFGEEPNTHCCPVCLGLPGALPVPNKKAIEWCIMIGLALNCKIPLSSKFDRKNYFYPDLPKGYQISQYDEPFAIDGYVMVKDEPNSPDFNKKIRIRRVHMEEDTGKLIHAAVNSKSVSLIDFNRSGVPLVEIVTEPDFVNPFEVTQYLQGLQRVVRYLGVSNADMEKGEMRLEPNISLKPLDSKELPSYKVEVKNINSFKFVERAIEVELARQRKILDEGEIPLQETRGWVENKQKTVSQRIKEEANDYRYFPEPDIPPFTWTDDYIGTLKKKMIELPIEKYYRFQKLYALSAYDAEIITREKEMADYFEEAVKVGEIHNLSPKQIANTIINKKITTDDIFPAQLVQQILASSQTMAIDEEKLATVIDQVLKQHPKAVEDYKNGKETVIMFLIGQVMKQYGEKIDTSIVREKLLSVLKN